MWKTVEMSGGQAKELLPAGQEELHLFGTTEPAGRLRCALAARAPGITRTRTEQHRQLTIRTMRNKKGRDTRPTKGFLRKTE